MASQSKIEQFIEELSVTDSEKYELLTELRNLVKEIYPKVTETFKYGGIMFSLNDNFGGLFVSKNHVSFEFAYGYKLTTQLNLEGSGKYRRHLKVIALDDDIKEKLKALLFQIESIDKC